MDRAQVRVSQGAEQVHGKRRRVLRAGRGAPRPALRGPAPGPQPVKLSRSSTGGADRGSSTGHPQAAACAATLAPSDTGSMARTGIPFLSASTSPCRRVVTTTSARAITASTWAAVAGLRHSPCASRVSTDHPRTIERGQPFTELLRERDVLATGRVFGLGAG